MPQARSAHEQSSDWQGSRASGRDRQSSRHAGEGRGSEDTDREQSQASRRSQGSSGHNGQKHKSPALNITASTLRGLGQFYDMQAATARLMLRAQVRAASAFGLPDYSRIFDVEDERARHLFSSATENLVNFVGQEEEILNEVPSQVFRLMEKQAIDATERWKTGLEELEHQATESVEELRELSRRQAEEFAQASESFAEAAHSTLRESGEQYRASMRQSGDSADRGEEAEREAMTDDADEDSEQIREAGHERGQERGRGSGERSARAAASREGGERHGRSHKAA